MPEGTGKRFERIAKELFGGNASEFARNMQMTPGAFTKYMNGDTMPGGKILKRLISLDINPAWVLSGIEPMRISEISQAGVTRIDFVNEMDEDDEAGKYKGTKNGTDTANPGNDYFSHINQSDLTETEKHLLEEVKHFSDFLQKTVLPLQVKRLMLELMIEHIDREIERLRGDHS